MKIMAIVGLTGSGKSEVAKFLEEAGYFKIRFGDVTEEELKKEGKEINEANERYMREKLRKEHGMSAYAIKNIPKIKQALEKGNVVIDGLYSWDEYLVLKNTFGKDFHVLAVQASPKTRYARLASRQIRPLNNEEAETRDHKEIENIQKGGPIAIAQSTILNEGTIEDLKSKVKEILNTTKRPTKDRYFMNITKEVAKRTTCWSVNGGAIIVKDNVILATGYIGAPRKTKDCIERGFCLRRKLNIPSGHRYELCRSVHAEMNCIINAARQGTSIQGADIYIYMIKILGGQRKEVDSIPCYMCKKYIINAGLKRVVCSMSDGTLKEFNVDDWVKDWRDKDLMDDEHKYDSKY